MSLFGVDDLSKDLMVAAAKEVTQNGLAADACATIEARIA
jgi:hypothetical protein